MASASVTAVEPAARNGTRTSGPASGLRINVRRHGFATRSGWTDVLRDIDVEIGQGEFFCLVGQSGCGKSTLLNIIAGFMAPTDGGVALDGRTLTGPSNDRVVVFQDVHNSLFPWMTVRENVEFGLKMLDRPADERKRRVDALLKLVGLVEHDDKFPDELSGGMKQRVQIARALAIGPKLLLMDEPFASLDAQTRRTMQNELLRIWGETRTSVLFITHDIIEAVTLADRIGVMSKGPGATIMRFITPSLTRPRALADGKFTALVGEVEQMLGRERTHG